jgi:hypothetical protein
MSFDLGVLVLDLVKQVPNVVPPDPVFEKGRKMEEEEEENKEKNEGFPLPGGDFVAPGNNKALFR